MARKSMANATSKPKPPTKPKPNFYPPWAPRFWSGMRVFDYFSLLNENRFRVHPTKWPMAFLVGGCSVMNSALSLVQEAFYRRRIDEVEIDQPPVFVIGHWRSGTTLMHELLASDSRFSFPSNFDAFVPNHLMVSRFFLYPLVKILMPGRRPMDNMKLDVAYPQEDDFALCSMGAPTPYRRVAFPNAPNRDHLSLNLSAASPGEIETLRLAMTRFVKLMTLRYGSRLVLKSPPHTGRIEQLVEWFPGAKFVHMARTPHKLVPSTMRLWRLIDSLQGFQVPRYDETALKNYVFECKELMYQAYFGCRDKFPDNQLVEVKFESLVKQPVEEMKRVYDRLELGGFESVKLQIQGYFESRKNHQTNPFSLEETLRADIDANWREYQQAFGYDSDE